MPKLKFKFKRLATTRSLTTTTTTKPTVTFKSMAEMHESQIYKLLISKLGTNINTESKELPLQPKAKREK